MLLRGLLSVVSRNVNRSFVNSATGYHVFRHGEPSVVCMGSEGSQSLHLSTLDFSKIPEPPKQPMTVFASFAMEKRQDHLKEMPDSKFKDLLKRCAADWKALSDKEKMPYYNRFEVESKEFKANKEKWWNSLTEEQRTDYLTSKLEEKKMKKRRAMRKTCNLLGKPKRPGNAYTCFIAQIDHSMIKKGQTLFDYASEAWKSMSEVDKQEFAEKANAEYVKYKKDLSEWENSIAAVKGVNKKNLVTTVKSKKKSPIIL